ncbi:predicted protein [Chaetoceros tenuissimus]|uniref:Uncharacterized protein n=1 Tax=Chaetoceros tenuissimus TaxID=426638 RepID=A0AAD3D291_9STRA|nr:predicted protein [Chaetoceros tenuissimus]
MTNPTLEVDTHLHVRTRLIALLHASKKTNESRKSLKKFEALKEDLLVLGSFSSTTFVAKECKARKNEEGRGSVQINEVLQDTRKTKSSPKGEDSFLNNDPFSSGAYFQEGKNETRKRKRNNYYDTIESDDRDETFSTCSDISWCDNFLYSPLSSPEFSFLEEMINRDCNSSKKESSMSNYDWAEHRSSFTDRERFYYSNQM